MNELLQELHQRRGTGAGSALLNKQQVNRLVGAAVSFVKKEFPCVDLDSIRRTIPEVDRLVSDAEAENAALRSKKQQFHDDSDAATTTSNTSSTTRESFATNTTMGHNNPNSKGKTLLKALVAVGSVAAVVAAGLANEVRRDSGSLPVQNIGQLMDLLRDVGIEPLHILTALSVVAGFFQRELELDMPGLLKLGNNDRNTAVKSDTRRFNTRTAIKTIPNPSASKKKQQPEEASTPKKTKKFPLFGKRRSKENLGIE